MRGNTKEKDVVLKEDFPNSSTKPAGVAVAKTDYRFVYTTIYLPLKIAKKKKIFSYPLI
jgi:hypothetical protein